LAIYSQKSDQEGAFNPNRFSSLSAIVGIGISNNDVTESKIICVTEYLLVSKDEVPKTRK
jgi:hypothetical protein